MEECGKPDARGSEESFCARGVTMMRSEGYKLTPQRMAILDVFDEVQDHLTPQEIFGRLEGSVGSLSLATVYNSLEVFEKVGILTKFCTEHGQTYYDPNPTPHHHALCEKCEEIYDLEIPESTMEKLASVLGESFEATLKFQIKETRIWFRGVCDRCR